MIAEQRRPAPGLLIPLAMLLLWLAPIAPAAAQNGTPGACQFILGFRTLHDLDPTDVGACVENQSFAANGDAQQRTANGLLVWRKADNFTAFTDGYHTWVNGPFGLQERLNSQRFPWEANPDGLPVVGSGAPSPAPGAPAWTLGPDHVLKQDVIIRTDGRNLQLLPADGVYVTVYFTVQNGQSATDFLTGNDFSLTDGQGRTYLSGFQLRRRQADGSSEPNDGDPIAPGERVAVWLTFEIARDASSLVLHLAGAPDLAL